MLFVVQVLGPRESESSDVCHNGGHQHDNFCHSNFEQACNHVLWNCEIDDNGFLSGSN